jgi:hypothetical protein
MNRALSMLTKLCAGLVLVILLLELVLLALAVASVMLPWVLPL